MECEKAQKYCRGGLLPIHLSDKFKKGRYMVIHKLGFGVYSTVWLAKDFKTGNLVSLKVLAMDAQKWAGNMSGGDIAIAALLLAESDVGSDEGKECVVRIIDQFEHLAENGVHHCIVMEVLGPNLQIALDQHYDDFHLPLDIARRFIKQICYGLRYLHRKGIVHGGALFLLGDNQSQCSHRVARPSPRQHSAVLACVCHMVHIGCERRPRRSLGRLL